jgi:hypothetical protein
VPVPVDPPRLPRLTVEVERLPLRLMLKLPDEPPTAPPPDADVWLPAFDPPI